jgi:predicted PurR-regulated permease PerM
MSKEKEQKVEKVEINLSWRTILLIVAGVLFFLFGSQLIGVFIILFLAFMLTSAILPIYRWLKSKKVPSTVALILVYFSMILLFAIILGLIIIPTVNQAEKLVENLPKAANEIADFIVGIRIPFFNIDRETVEKSLDQLVNDISADLVPSLLRGIEGLQSTIEAVAGVVSGVISAVTVVLVSVYLVADHDELVDHYLLRIVDEKYHKNVKDLIYKLEKKLGNWFLGQGLLMFIIGLATWILLTIFNVPFALPLAVLAGTMEIIPNLGPTLAAAIALPFVLINGDFVQLLLVAGGFFVIQQVENTYLVPKIMGDVVGIRPIIILVSMLFGFALGGVVGALLTVPILVVIKAFWHFWQEIRKYREK